MLLLDRRLRAVYDAVEPCGVFADVGWDHAYLPIFLLLEAVIQKALITDVRKGPLANSRKNALRYGVADRCEFLLGDGLEVLMEKHIDILSVCGMGAETICAMLKDKKDWTAGLRYMIFQPMTQAETLRKFLHENGYGIFKESIVQDGRNYYQILCASAREMGETEKFRDGFDYEFSPFLIETRSETMRDFLTYRLAVETEILANMQATVCTRSNDVIQKIAFIKERISRYDTCRNHQTDQ